MQAPEVHPVPVPPIEENGYANAGSRCIRIGDSPRHEPHHDGSPLVIIPHKRAGVVRPTTRGLTAPRWTRWPLVRPTDPFGIYTEV